MSDTTTVQVPDIGDFEDVEIIEVIVSPGDTVAPEDPLITLESDKASIEIPAPQGGTVKELKVKTGDRVSEGDPILELEPAGDKAAETEATGKDDSAAATGQTETAQESGSESKAGGAPQTAEPEPESPRHTRSTSSRAPERADASRPSPTRHIRDEEAFRKAHASPAVRKFARELGVDLSRVEGSGRKGRILREDVQAFVKRTLSQGTGGGVWAWNRFRRSTSPSSGRSRPSPCPRSTS